MTVNRRRTLRVTRELPAAWQRERAWIPVRVLNTSAQGLFLGTESEIVAGESIEVMVGIPGGPVSMTVIARFVGETRWGHGVGAQIVTISPADHDRWIRDYRAAARRHIDTLPGSIAKHLLGRT